MAFFTFKKGAIEQAEFLPTQDLASAGIEEKVLRDLLVAHLPQLDKERKLKVLACEYTSWIDAKRFIDVLAIDEDQNLVVVELKRTKDGGHAELQALRYAAMLSTHTFANVVDALLEHRRKGNKATLREDIKNELLLFFGLTDENEVTLSEMPRIMLVSQGSSVEITTTVLWLRDHTDIDISCHTVALYPYGDKLALHFDLLLPLQEQASYLVKVKDKNIAEAKQAETVKRQQRACQTLEKSGQLNKGDKLELVKLPHPKMNITNPLQKVAIYQGEGKVRWEFDQQIYSLSPLTIMLCEEHKTPIKSIRGPAYWGKAGGQLSLAEDAENYISASPFVLPNDK